MTQIGFYHLTTSPLERALPRLLSKVLEAGHRIVVMAGSPDRVEWLNDLLWTFSPDSWLPHGSRRDGIAAEHPVWLTDDGENPNNADILVLTDGVSPHQITAFSRCLVLFDGTDETALERARSQWKEWQEQHHELVYLQQTEGGGWKEKKRVKPDEAGPD